MLHIMSQPMTLLTSSQVAALLGKSTRTIQRMVDNGKLEPFGKLPGTNGPYLFDPKVVNAHRELASDQPPGALQQLATQKSPVPGGSGTGRCRRTETATPA